MSKLLTTLIFGFAMAGMSYAEDPVLIKGIIKDKETNQSIPFAHVIIGNRVNVTNIDGEFAMEFSTGLKELELKVSYIGYQTHTEIITDFDAYHTIFIEASTTKLEDVTVKSGPQIMDRVFDRLHLNYIMEPLLIYSQYEESMRDTVGYCYRVEGLIDIYTPSNVDYRKTPVATVVSAEKIIFKEFDETNILDGNACDMAHSSIWRRNSFLNKKNSDNYDFFYNGARKIGQHNVLVVDFEPKNKRAWTKGTLYIDDITYAVLNIEYEPIIRRNKFWDEVKWTEKYKLIDGAFQLTHVTYNGVALDQLYTYKASLNVNNREVRYEIPQEAIMSVYDALFDMAENAQDEISFKSGYHIIELDSPTSVKTELANSFSY